MKVDYFDDFIAYNEYYNLVRNRTTKEGFIRHWKASRNSEEKLDRCLSVYGDAAAREAARLYLQGETIYGIAKRLGVPSDCVREFLKMYGHVIRPRTRERVSEAVKKHIIELYLQGESIYSIAKRLNLSIYLVRKVLIDAGVHKPSAGKSKKKKNRITGEIKRKILELYSLGYNTAKIAEMLGISKSVTWRIVREAGMIRTTKRRLNDAEKKMIIEMYQRGESIYSIAKKLGRSPYTILYYLKKVGLHD